jgi:hypothetical protein
MDMNEPKIFVPKSSGKEIEFRNGGKLLKLNFNADALVDFVNAHKNEKGYITLLVNRRREPDEHKNTHYLTLDTFVPNSSARPASTPAPRPASPPQDRPQVGPNESKPTDDEQSDVPF